MGVIVCECFVVFLGDFVVCLVMLKVRYFIFFFLEFWRLVVSEVVVWWCVGEGVIDGW